MYILGFNLPLAEFMFAIVLLLLACLVVIIFHLRKLEKMTSEERSELQELEKITLEEKDAIQKMNVFENEEQADLTKFEEDIKLLEGKDAKYMQKVIPDIYTLQNYVLWALKKGMNNDEIKSYLESKGWTDKELIDMVIDDMSRYVKYYDNRKGDDALPVVKIHETTKIIKPTRIITHRVVEERPKKARSPRKKKADKTLDKVEEELKKLEEDIKRSGGTESKPAKKAKAKKKTAKSKKAQVVKVSASAKTPKKASPKPRSKKPVNNMAMVIGTKGGNKYHDPTCIAMKKTSKAKVVTFKDADEAIKKGYKPCTVCQVERKSD